MEENPVCFIVKAPRFSTYLPPDGDKGGFWTPHRDDAATFPTREGARKALYVTLSEFGTPLALQRFAGRYQIVRVERKKTGSRFVRDPKGDYIGVRDFQGRFASPEGFRPEPYGFVGEQIVPVHGINTADLVRLRLEEGGTTFTETVVEES